MPTTSVKPKVVIVGGSFGGLCAIRHLRQHADVTVIEPKNYFEYTPGMLHLLTGSNAKKALIAGMDECADGSVHIRGFFEGVKPLSRIAVVKSIDGKTVSEVSYDMLVICTGTAYVNPIRPSTKTIDVSSRYIEIDAFKKKLMESKKVVVLGGGLVGVELAAEIVHRLGSAGLSTAWKRQVVLISRSELLGALPRQAGEHALRWLRKHGVDILLGDEVKEIVPSPASSITDAKLRRETINTTGGRKIEDIDLIVDCTNSKTSLLWRAEGQLQKEAEGKCSPADFSAISPEDTVVWPYNKDGLVDVNENLQATWNPFIFAAGDAVELTFGVGSAASTAASGPYGTKSMRSAVRNAHLAESQAELVAENVLRSHVRSLAGAASSSSPLLSYPQHSFYGAPVAPLLSCVSLGPNCGIVVFNDLVLGGFLFGLLGGFVKFIIERSKVAEIRQKSWGRMFWAFGHVVVNSVHRVAHEIRNFIVEFKKQSVFEKLKTLLAAVFSFFVSAVAFRGAQNHFMKRA